jgi:hypothetical protein
LEVRPFLAIVLVLFWASMTPAAQTAKAAGRAFVEDMKHAGREIRDSKAGKAATEAGKEIGHAGAQLGREVARVSTQAAKDVRRVTIDYWDRALAAKRRRVAELRKENRELKRDKEH